MNRDEDPCAPVGTPAEAAPPARPPGTPAVNRMGDNTDPWASAGNPGDPGIPVEAPGNPGAGTCYLLHFSEPYKHARHYSGTATDLQARLGEHEKGNGARLLQVAKAAGITWTLARTWPGGRSRERQLKNQGGASRRCPECGVQPRSKSKGRKEAVGMKQPQDHDAGHMPGTRPPEYVIVTWVSEQLRDRIQRNGKSLAEALQAPDTQKSPPEAELEAEP